MKFLFVLIVVTMFTGFFNGCTAVQPWERENLSDPIMIFDENPIDQGIKEHYLDYREGTVGGTGAQSGGCGCG